jgi:hypothetical protein
MKRIVPLLVVFATFCVSSFAQDLNLAEGQGRVSIVGTWIGKLIFDTPPGAPPFAISELVSFNESGTVMGTNGISHFSANPFVPPALAVDLSEHFGSWVRIGESNRFAVTFKRLLFGGSNTPTAIYGVFSPGQEIGLATIQVIGLVEHTEAGDQISGRFAIQFKNRNGEVVFTASGNVSLSRMEVEPLVP